MPSRPSAARRRFHSRRIVANRIAAARAIAHLDLAEIVPGRLADGQLHLGCNRTRCRLCHPHKYFPNADRQRAAQAWRDDARSGEEPGS